MRKNENKLHNNDTSMHKYSYKSIRMVASEPFAPFFKAYA